MEKFNFDQFKQEFIKLCAEEDGKTTEEIETELNESKIVLEDYTEKN